MNENNVKRNSPKAWLLAIRPKTLSAAVIPVVVACAMAYADGGFKLFPAVVCMIFAALMQIASNLINDIYDFMHGSDREDRLGPQTCHGARLDFTHGNACRNSFCGNSRLLMRLSAGARSRNVARVSGRSMRAVCFSLHHTVFPT